MRGRPKDLSAVIIYGQYHLCGKVIDFLNNFAISSDGIAEGLQRSASTLVAAGNSLEQSIAMLAAGNKVAQDPEGLGNALKVLSMRIRGTKTELEGAGEETDGLIENTSKLQAKVKALTDVNGNGGVDILTDTGAYRSTYDILLDIAEVWDDINDANPKNQAALLEILAGKTRGSQLAAILQNPEDLRDAYEMALDSDGSALKENEKYLDSIQGKIDQFNNSIQTMWMNLIGSETVKDVVELGTDLIKLADDIGVVNIALTALAMRMSAKYFKVDFAQLFNIGNLKHPIKSAKDWFGTIIGGATTASDNLNILKKTYEDAHNAWQINPSQDNLNSMKAAKENLETYSSEMQNLTDSNKKFEQSGTKSFASVGKKVEGFVGQIQSAVASMLVMYAITKLIDFVGDIFDKNNESAEEAKQSFDDLTSELSNTKSKLKDLESELSNVEDQIAEINQNTPLSFTDQEDLERLKAESEELRRQIEYTELLEKQQQLGVNQSAVNAAEKYKQTGKNTGKTVSENVGSKAGSGALLGAGVGVATGVGTAILGAKGGAALGAWAGPVGMLIGAAVGAIGGAIVGTVVGGIESATDETIGETMDSMTENYKRLQYEMQTAREKYMQSGNTEDQKKYEEALKAFNNYQAEMATYMTEMDSMYSQMDWDTATEEERKAMQEFYNQRDKWAIISGGKDAQVAALDRLFGEDASKTVQEYIAYVKDAVAAGETITFEETDAEVLELDDDLEELGITTKDVTNYFNDLGDAGADAVEKIDFSDAVSELAKVEGALESMKSVMEEFQTEGIVSASTLDGLDEEIKKLDAFDEYAEVLMSGTASRADVDKVTEKLAKEYLDDNADKLTSDNKLSYIAQLEEMGVVNASKMVDSYLSESFWNSAEFKNFKGGYEELIELAKEYGVVIDENAEKEIQGIADAKNNVDTAQSQYNTQQQELHELRKRNKEKENKVNSILSVENYKWLYDNYLKEVDYAENYAKAAGLTDEQIEQRVLAAKNSLSYALENGVEGYTWEDLFPEFEAEIGDQIKIETSQQNLKKYKDELQDKLNAMDLKVTPEVNFNDNNALEETAEVEEAFAKLGEAYKEFKEYGIVDATSLVELQEVFKNVDGFEEFTNILGDSTSTIEQVTVAIEGLANGFLNNFDYSKILDENGQVIESEATRVASQLENIGVANAKALITQKAEAYNAVKEMYGIDLTNYESAEEAKTDWLAQKLGESVNMTGEALVNELADQYKLDLDNFKGNWEDKVKAAKAAAIEIARANAAAQLSELDEKYEPDFYDANNPEALKAEKLWLNMRKKIQDDLAKAEAEINAIDTSIIAGDNNILQYYKPTTINPDKLGGNDDKDGSDSDNELDWLDHYFTKIENKIKEKEADLENAISADVGSIDDKNTIIDGIIGLYDSKIPLLENAINAYNNRATALFNGFSGDIQNKILNGSIDINKYDDETAEKIQDYFDYITKASDLEIELDGVKVTIADFSLQKFDNAATAFDNEIEEKFQSDQDLLEAEIGYLEEQGKRVDPKLYEKLISIQKDEQKILENKKKTLENIFATEVDLGHIQIGSEQWYEMTNALNDVDEALIESKNDIESFQNAINEIYWDNFDKLIDQIDAVNSELSNLFDLLSEDEKVVDEFGNWTDEGIASLGLLAQQMENAQAKADKYAKAIKDLDKDYADGKYSLDEYNEKMAELKDAQLSEIKNIEDAKDAMVDINKVRVEAVKEAIDKEIEALEEKNEKLKEELDLEKEQYDFQKQVAEQEKSMVDIQRRLNALAGDTSASAVAERRKLEAEMAQAKSEMDDMWYEHSIEEQQKSLDESLENYKENKEDEKEALDKWLEDEEKVIQESFDLFNSNVDIVSSVLKAFEQEHGINLTDAIVNPWNSGIDAMTAYRNELAKMQKLQDDAKQNAEDTADDIVESLDKPQATTPPVVNQPSGSGSTTTEPEAPKSAPGYGSTVTVKKSATNFSRNGGNGTKMQSWVPGSSFTVYGSDNDEVLIGRNGGYTGWVKLSDIEGYYKGTTGVKDDQWAFTDELGDELTLHAGPNGRLQYLTKGSGVVTADLTKRLMEWGELDPTKVLEQSRVSVGAPHITTNNFDIDLSFGSLVHVDHCDQNTLPDLQKMVRGEFDNMMKTLNQKLKRK